MKDFQYIYQDLSSTPGSMMRNQYQYLKGPRLWSRPRLTKWFSTHLETTTRVL